MGFRGRRRLDWRDWAVWEMADLVLLVGKLGCVLYTVGRERMHRTACSVDRLVASTPSCPSRPYGAGGRRTACAGMLVRGSCRRKRHQMSGYTDPSVGRPSTSLHGSERQ